MNGLGCFVKEQGRGLYPQPPFLCALAFLNDVKVGIAFGIFQGPLSPPGDVRQPSFSLLTGLDSLVKTQPIHSRP